MHLRARTPLRVSFAGGGTDVPPFPQNEGGCVLSATIGRYVYGGLEPRNDGQIGIDSPDLGVSMTFSVKEEVELDGTLDLIKAAVRRLGKDEVGGYDLFVNSSAPPGSGLGSSSAVMVTLVGLLNERYQLGLDDYEVAQLAWSVEREDLGIRGGYQDHYAAAFGGFNFIEFHADHVVVNPLRIKDRTLDELEHALLLVFTGRTRASDHIIEDQSARVERGEADPLAGLRAQKELAHDMKRILLQGKVNDFGAMLGQAWHEKKRMSPRITNADIDEAYAIACENGALGGKITGAGGGGFMLLHCEFRRRHRVVEALEKLGMRAESISFDQRGLTTWRSR
ncbi:MAG TPA: GHMP kinase [Mycobacteriales bacterium]|nr:GHMP kinase [Mycobacteriales bacterium]